MYDNKDQFIKDVEKNLNFLEAKSMPDFYKGKFGSKTNWDLEYEDGWLLYNNAKTSNFNSLILGEKDIRITIDILRNLGTTAGMDTVMKMRSTPTYLETNKKGATKKVNKLLTEEKIVPKGYKEKEWATLMHKGSVLNDGWWWPYKNDAWILGGVHGLRSFHISPSAVGKDKNLWDNKDGRPAMLGRELIGLKAFGYKRIKADKSNGYLNVHEYVYAPGTKKVAFAASFTKYYDAIKKVTSIKELKKFIDFETITHSKYDFKKL